MNPDEQPISAPVPRNPKPTGKKDGSRSSPEMSLATALAHPRRWQILRELALGQALPTAELNRRLKTDSLREHLQNLRNAGLVEKKFGTLNALTAAVRVDQAAGVLDLGPFLLKLDPSPPR